MIAPNNVVRGIINKMAAINSAIPVPIRPQGSIPNVVNNSTDSGRAVNLKYKVCNSITAAKILKNHINIVFFM